MPFFPRARKSGRGRRRQDDAAGVVGFELDSLEFVQASDDLGLLRVGGRWVAPAKRALGEITLAVARDTESLTLSPLPDMNAGAPLASPTGEAWRGAFTMSVDVAEDPRSQFALVAGDDARVALPRPGEFEPEPPSPVVADLVAQLEEVALLDEEEDAEPAPDLDPVTVPEPPTVAEASHRETEQIAELRAQLDVQRAELAAAQAELEAERGRRQALEQELEARASVEDDLRNAIATQEAELASAEAQASQRARQAERRRDLAPPRERAEHPERPRSRPADEEFVARLERARRATESIN